MNAQLTAPDGRALNCPYSGCDGVVSETGLAAETVGCPTCGRLAARCTRVSKHRCRTLNRPLAWYCRCCGQPLGPGWAEACWSQDLPGGSAGSGRPLGLEQTGRPVLGLDEYFRYDALAWGPLGLVAAAGRLWIGAHDGRYLFVDPFRRPNDPRPVLGERLWPDARPARLQACQGGVWMLMYGAHGIKAFNLLRLDDPDHGEYLPLTVWQADGMHRLASEPVLLARPAAAGLDRLDRTAAWVTARADGLSLWLAQLSAAEGLRGRLQRIDLDSFKELLTGEGTETVAVLTAAPLGDRDGLILCTRRGVCLLELPFGASNRSTRVRLLLTKPRFLIRQQELTGVVFAPAAPDAAGDARGTLYVAHRSGAASDREALEVAAISSRGLLEHFPCLDYGALPLDVVQIAGKRQALCLAGDALVLTDPAGSQTRVLSNGFLPGTVRAHVYRHLAVCTGMEASEGQSHWFALLADLRQNALIPNGLLVTPSLAAHPVVLGDRLFSLEGIDGRLYLTVRRLDHPTPGPAPRRESRP